MRNPACLRGPREHAAITDPAIAHLAMFTILLPDQQILYTWTPKVACTSLKWLLADAIGMSEHGSLAPFNSSSRAMTIHDRNRYPFRSLADLDDAARQEVFSSGEWMRFCVVRDPFARTFSAWSHMVLLREPHMLESFENYGFGGGELSSDVGDMFADFLRRLSADRSRWFADGHFATQTSIVLPDRIPYTDIVRVEALGEFEDRLDSRLRRDGATPGGIPRINEGVRFPYRDNYDAESAAIVRDVYAEDFDSFGYSTDLDTAGFDPTILTATEIALVDEIRLRNERIYSIVRSGQRQGGTHGARLVARALGKKTSTIVSRIKPQRR